MYNEAFECSAILVPCIRSDKSYIAKVSSLLNKCMSLEFDNDLCLYELDMDIILWDSVAIMLTRSEGHGGTLTVLNIANALTLELKTCNLQVGSECMKDSVWTYSQDNCIAE